MPVSGSGLVWHEGLGGWLSSHKGQWHFMTIVSHVVALWLLDSTMVCPGWMQESTRMGWASNTWVVSLEYINMQQAFGLNTLKRFTQPMWRGGNEGWLANHRGDPFKWFSLVATTWSASVALPLVIWDTPLPPNVHFRSWRLMRVFFSTGPNHLSQGVRYCAEGCMALGWNLASVMNNPLRAPDSTPLYLCLPPVWGAADGNLLNPHYSWDHYGNQNKKSGPQDLKKGGTPLHGHLYKKYFSRGLEAPVHC
jgi:hypothetical protein